MDRLARDTQVPANHFQTRRVNAALSDLDFIINCFDTTLASLSSIGSGAQWGTIPFSQRPAFVYSISKAVEVSNGDKEKNVDGHCVLVAERCINSDRPESVPCGAAILSSRLPVYIDAQIEQVESILAKCKFTYLHHLISDRAAGSCNKGAGKALLTHIKERALLAGYEILLVDCWSGNDGALVQ